jgi:hypothetical protein
MVEQELINQYKIIHKQYKYGSSGIRLLADIQPFVDQLKPESILDYGCGNSKLLDKIETEAEKYKYDPAMEEYNELKIDKVDLLLCTDVIEHLPVNLIHDFIKRLKALSENIILCISTQPAEKTLPNGMNAHLTIMSIEAWIVLLRMHFDNVLICPHKQQRSEYLMRTFK